MRKFYSFVLAVLLTVPAFAQQRTVVNEAMTVTGTATVFSAATLAALAAASAICTGVLETAPVRMTLDGTTPTSTVGVPIAVGQQVTVHGYDNLQNFKSIRTTSTSGTIYWSCSK